MRTIIILILIFYTALKSYSQWSYIGLFGTKTTDLTIYDDTIYASTYDGIYKKNILSSDTIWSACGMQGKHVIQTFIPDYQTFICVVEIGSSHTTQIYKSTDGGNYFSLLNNNISMGSSYTYLDKMAHPEGNYDTLYFVDHLLRTFDGGITWDTLINIIININRFITVNPINHSQLLIGGETTIFSAYMQTSFDYGDNWQRLPIMDSYFQGDNALHDMVIDGNDWFAVGEMVIGKTSDGGDNWEQMLMLGEDYPDYWGLYIMDIEFSPSDKNKLYATGCGFETDIIPLLFSSNRGISWDTLSYNPSNISDGSLSEVTCLTIKSIANRDIVFLGGNGVYKYENNFVGILNNITESAFNVFPNPANKKFTITIPSSAKQVQIINMQGKVIEHGLVNKQTELKFEIGSDGIYIIQVITNKEILTQKVIIQ